MPITKPSDLNITEYSLENSYLFLKIENGTIYINGIKMSLVDFTDLGDSYNFGPKSDDKGNELKILRSKVVLKTHLRAALKVDFESVWDVVSATISLDRASTSLSFKFDWVNSQKNHILNAVFELNQPIQEVFSEDMNVLIKRKFDADYNIRENLPKIRGVEVKNNTAPMQRGLLIDEENNNIGIVTKGLTQYEVYKNTLMIPILRSTGVISNPQNPARTTPAGPPIPVESLQQIGRNIAEFHVFFGNQNAFEETLNKVYNYVVTTS